MFAVWRRRAAAGWALLAGVAVANGATVDRFSTAQNLSLQYYRNSFSITGGAPEALGGERDLTLVRVGGASSAGFGSSVFGERGLQFLSAATVVGAASVVWDGPDGDPWSLDADGLGGLDWLVQGYRALAVEVAVADHPAHVVLTAYSANDPSGRQFVSQSFAVPAGAAGMTFQVPLVEFASASYTAAEVFSNLGALKMDVLDLDRGALDLMIDSVTLSIVPEPVGMGMAVAACGGVALVQIGRKRPGASGVPSRRRLLR